LCDTQVVRALRAISASRLSSTRSRLATHGLQLPCIPFSHRKLKAVLPAIVLLNYRLYYYRKLKSKQAFILNTRTINRTSSKIHVLLEGKFHSTTISFRVLRYTSQSSLHSSFHFIHPPKAPHSNSAYFCPAAFQPQNFHYAISANSCPYPCTLSQLIVPFSFP
jgi:hypothetical protein